MIITLTTNQFEKTLGVIIDNELSFKKHIYDCVNRASKVCNIIFANIKHVNNSTLIKLYKSFARPLLEYGSVIYCPHPVFSQLMKTVKLKSAITKK